MSIFTKKTIGVIGLLIVLFLLLDGCNYTANVRLLLGGKLERKDFVATIPFDYRKGLIVVKAKVNKDKTLREFIFDTGAFNSKIEKSLAERLGLPTVATKSNSTAQGIERKIEVTRIESLSLGGTTFENISAGKLAYAENSASPCIAADGIIGANLIKLAHWKIDYENRKLYCSDHPFLPDPSLPTYRFPFQRPLLSGTPTVSLKLESEKKIDVLLDAGYNGGLILPAAVGQTLQSPVRQVIFDQSTTGIYGSNADTLTVRDTEVWLGEYAAQLPVTFSALGKSLLGNDFLEHFIVFIDYDKKEIQLQPNTPVAIDEEPVFFPSILSDSLWVVNRSSPFHPLQIGDTLLTINGLRPVEAFTDHCAYFMGVRQFISGDSLVIQKKNGEKVVLK